jgi:hypothetical protein
MYRRGGLGTLDEVFETATLEQTGKLRDFPVVLVGSDFWRPIVGFLTLIDAGTIDPADLPASPGAGLAGAGGQRDRRNPNAALWPDVRAAAPAPVVSG